MNATHEHRAGGDASAIPGAQQERVVLLGQVRDRHKKQRGRDSADGAHSAAAVLPHHAVEQILTHPKGIDIADEQAVSSQ